LSLLLDCTASVLAAVIVLTVSTHLPTLRHYHIQNHHRGEAAIFQHALAENGTSFQLASGFGCG
jgi:hypothetical protein